MNRNEEDYKNNFRKDFEDDEEDVCTFALMIGGCFR
jgi:hypothetical protein